MPIEVSILDRERKKEFAKFVLPEEVAAHFLGLLEMRMIGGEIRPVETASIRVEARKTEPSPEADFQIPDEIKRHR